MHRGVLGAAAVTVLLALYVWAVAGRAIVLVRTGEVAGIAIGVAVLVLPVLAVWLVLREWRLAAHVQRMADELAAAGELDIDDLPRSPGGRIDRAAADAAFEASRDSVEHSPEDWKAWFRVGFAYDAAHDRRRARHALRQAARLRGSQGR